jgi:hypothetical protein
MAMAATATPATASLKILEGAMMTDDDDGSRQQRIEIT